MHRTALPLKTLQSRSLIAAGAGIVLCGLLSFAEPDRLWRAYVFAFFSVWLVTMGATGLLALGNLTGGRWAQAARPFYLAMAQTLPLVAILFLPIALSLARIYPWAHTGSGADHVLPPSKAAYFDSTFFLGRAAGYFVVWLLVVWWQGAVSKFDRPPASTPSMRRAGALSLVLLVPTATFAAFDWGMSLEPEWYSSIYGAILTAGGVVAAQSLAICSMVLTGNHDAELVADPTAEAAAVGELHDLGNLLLAFVMLFTYFAFSQFLIIWSGNLPSETTWYVVRLNGGWQWMALCIALFNFVVPFLILLSRDVKRTPQRLMRVAVLLLVMYNIHLYWNIVPAFAESGFAWHATNLAILAVLGGGWLAAYCWHAARAVRALPTDEGAEGAGI